MILNNAIPRLSEAMRLTEESKQDQEVPFIYNELLTYDTIGAVCLWIIRQGYEFTTRQDEYRFVIIIHPKKHP